MATFTKAAVLAAALPYLASAAYSLSESYDGTSLYDGFNFINAADVSGGWVTYVTQDEANSKNLLSTGDDNAARIGVDHSSTIDPSAAGRSAVRLSSKQAWSNGLFIFDSSHMPGGICGTWPAFWLLGNGASGAWPKTGEWDILENVNTATQNQLTGHTNSGCNNSGEGANGKVLQSNCNAGSGGEGCGTQDTGTSTWGAPLNQGNGGVWATEKTSTSIKTWFFARDSIPADITDKAPNPSSWGTPVAILSNDDGCNVGEFFPDPLNIIINTDFCGDWAQGQWSSSGCQASTGTSDCKTYVGGNPDAFADAYWDINYVRVYQDGSAAGAAAGAPVNASVPAVNDPAMGGPGFKGVDSAPFYGSS